MVKLHVYYEHMRIVRHMLITICRTTMLDLSQITKQLYTKRRVWWGTVADRPPISQSFHG